MTDGEVWWAHPDLVLPAGVLDPRESARAERYRHEVDARRFLVGAALVRQALAVRTGLEPSDVPIDRRCACGQSHGPPRLPGSGVRVSVTHAGDVVAVAVADVPVGVDVEPAASATRAWDVRQLIEGPGESFTDPDESLAAWVAKEAVLKATGDGLAVPMTTLALTSGPDGSRRVADWTAQPQLVPRLRLAPLGLVGYVGVVALLDAAPTDTPLQVRLRQVHSWADLVS